MYSRYPHRHEAVRLPEHYSGCAFSAPQKPYGGERQLEIAKPTPPVLPPDPKPEPEPEPCPPPIEPPPFPVPCEEKKPPSPPLPLPFANGLDFDQLLLLGLILLLWGNESDRDVVLWLGLLLLWS
ncbi:MAG: hypothetical protein IJW30_04010 [Clostridia bacterium]|nr:hypothetical protein [Clostridia bacterium]